ncbi:MAG: ComF family protein [Candidatus Obscuribacterales bacterium]
MTNSKGSIIEIIPRLNPGALLFQERCRQCGKPVEDSLLRPDYRRALTALSHFPECLSGLTLCLCADCAAGLRSSKPPRHAVRDETGEALPVLTAAVYDGAARKLIRKLKYDEDRLCAFDLALIAVSSLGIADLLSGSLIVPVPLHRRKQRRRGFNQADLIAGHLARLTGARVLHRALRRTRDTAPQFGLCLAERRLNVAGAFEADPVPGKTTTFPGTNIIILDDVFTTGSTIGQCAGAMRKGGWQDIIALTIARAPFERI